MFKADEGIDDTADWCVPGLLNSGLSNYERILLLFLIIPAMKETKAILEKVFCPVAADTLLFGDSKLPPFCYLLLNLIGYREMPLGDFCFLKLWSEEINDVEGRCPILS